MHILVAHQEAEQRPFGQQPFKDGWKSIELIWLNDMRKLIELNLAEYQRQTKTMVGDFSNATKMEMEVIKTTTENHAKITTLAVGEITVQLANAESVARQVKCLMDSAPSQWNAIKADTTAQCKQLAQVSDDLRDRFAWRMVLELVIFFLFVSGISILTGHYLWTR